MLRHSVVHACAQGQCDGRCRTARRWGRASRAGMLTMRRRNVIPRATALAAPASTPAARSRLWAIAAHKTQAALAPKQPDGICANGPSIRSANTVSMIACWRWVMSASAVGRSVLVKNGWYRQTGNNASPKRRP
jgi:hypothetical protein